MIRIIIGSIAIAWVAIIYILAFISSGYDASLLGIMILMMLATDLPFIGILLWGVVARRRAKMVRG